MRSAASRLSVAILATALLSACGPGLGQADRPTRAPSALETATGNPAAIEKLLRGTVVNGGMWWNTPDCVRTFPVPSEVRPDLFSAFARCIAGLQLVPSARTDALPDVTVFTYEPGFEIEARIVDDGCGPRLAWIGFVARSGPNDPLPTISPLALEGLRLAGDPNGPIDPGAPGLEPRRLPLDVTWFKICLDASGTVTRLQPRLTTSPTLMRMFEAAATTWRFKPFVANGQAQPVCSMIRMRYPTTLPTEPEEIPLPVGEGSPLMMASSALKRLSGESLIVPDDRDKLHVQNAGVITLTGVFRACIDEAGRVVEVKTLRPTGLPSYDRQILTAISSYVYEPVIDQARPIPVCTTIKFIYTQR